MNLKMDSDSNMDPIEYNNNVEMKELNLKGEQQQRSSSEKDRGEHKKNKKKKREKRDREKHHRDKDKDDKKTSSTVTSTGYPHNLKIKFLLSAVIQSYFSYLYCFLLNLPSKFLGNDAFARNSSCCVRCVLPLLLKLNLKYNRTTAE